MKGFWPQQISSSGSPPEIPIGSQVAPPNEITVDPLTGPWAINSSQDIVGSYTDLFQTITQLSLYRSNDGGTIYNPVAGEQNILVSGGVFIFSFIVQAPESTQVIYKIVDSTGGNIPLAEVISNQIEVTLPPNSITVNSITSPKEEGVSFNITGSYVDYTEEINRVTLYRSNDGGPFNPVLGRENLQNGDPGVLLSGGVFSIEEMPTLPLSVNVIYKVKDVTIGNSPQAEGVSNAIEIVGDIINIYKGHFVSKVF